MSGLPAMDGRFTAAQREFLEDLLLNPLTPVLSALQQIEAAIDEDPALHVLDLDYRAACVPRALIEEVRGAIEVVRTISRLVHALDVVGPVAASLRMGLLQCLRADAEVRAEVVAISGRHLCHPRACSPRWL